MSYVDSGRLPTLLRGGIVLTNRKGRGPGCFQRLPASRPAGPRQPGQPGRAACGCFESEIGKIKREGRGGPTCTESDLLLLFFPSARLRGSPNAEASRPRPFPLISAPLGAARSNAPDAQAGPRWVERAMAGQSWAEQSLAGPGGAGHTSCPAAGRRRARVTRPVDNVCVQQGPDLLSNRGRKAYLVYRHVADTVPFPLRLNGHPPLLHAHRRLVSFPG